MAGDVIRQVPEKFHAPLSEKLAHIELECIAVNDFQARIAESLAQKFCEPLIFFDRDHARARLQNELGERSQPWTDFDDVIGR